MIDIHTHILPNLDDGSEDLEETLEMLEYSASMSVTDVILTPHVQYDDMMGITYLQKVEEVFEEVKYYVEMQDIQIRLYLGMEVFASPLLEIALENQELLTLAKTRYILVEFPFEADIDYIFEALFILERYGLKPIIAHPERYEIVKSDPSIAYEWNKRGYILQINSGSILGELGRTAEITAKILLDHNLAQIIASDCHHLKNRAPNLNRVYEFISHYYSEGYADLLLTLNPDLLLKNKKILIVNPRNPRRS